MKKIVASLAALAAMSAVAAPAAAQPYGGYDRYDRGYEDRYDRGHEGRYDRHDRGDWRSVNERQDQLERRIERGLRRGDLTPREAYRLRAEFRQIARLEARYRYDGLSRWERADLDRRFDHLEAQIRYERRDRDYGYRY